MSYRSKLVLCDPSWSYLFTGLGVFSCLFTKLGEFSYWFTGLGVFWSCHSFFAHFATRSILVQMAILVSSVDKTQLLLWRRNGKSIKIEKDKKGNNAH